MGISSEKTLKFLFLFFSQMTEYVTVPSDLVCLKCKYCSHPLHAQSMADFETHFRLEHPTVKNPKKHLDYLCRVCMQTDLYDTMEDLEQHIDEEHSDLVKDQNDAEKSGGDANHKDLSNPDATATPRSDAKATSPDVSSSVDIAKSVISNVVEALPLI